MRLEKYQNYYIKKIGHGMCEVYDINQNLIQTCECIESAKNHIQALRKIKHTIENYTVSAYDNDNDTFFDFVKTYSKKTADFVYKSACKSFKDNTLNHLSGFNLKDVDFIGLYKNRELIEKYDIYDRKKDLKKKVLNKS